MASSSIRFSPCQPCCVSKSVYCHPRVCYRFVQGYSKEPITVNVLQAKLLGLYSGVLGSCPVISGDGTTWCFDYQGINDGTGECVPTEWDITTDPNQVVMCSLMAEITWDRPEGGPTCSGWVYSPPAACCAAGDPEQNVVDWPICCPQLCYKVSSPPIPGGPGCGVNEFNGVGIDSVTVSDTPSDFMIIPYGGTVLFGYSNTGGVWLPGLKSVECSGCQSSIDCCTCKTSHWENDCGPPLLFYTCNESAGLHCTAPDGRLTGQADWKIVANPYTNYQMAGACGDEIHRIWGHCQAFRYKPCTYNEVSLELVEHGGTTVPWCVGGCIEKCSDVPITNYLNPVGELLCSTGTSDIPSLNVQWTSASCCGFTGSKTDFDCDAYAQSKITQYTPLPGPSCSPGDLLVGVPQVCQHVSDHGTVYTWNKCQSFGGCSFKGNWCNVGLGDTCPVCTSCYQGTENVKSYQLSVRCIAGVWSAAVSFYLNDQCKNGCIKCADGTVKCQENGDFGPAGNWNPIAVCSGNVGKPCWQWGNDYMNAGRYEQYGGAGGPCPQCPDCCFIWWNGYGCVPHCDPTISCDQCDGVGLYGGTVVSLEPLLIEFRDNNSQLLGTITK